MKATVCELPNDQVALEKAWEKLVDHVHQQKSEFVLLPEMPFFRWLAHTQDVDRIQWEQAVKSHEDWLTKLEALGPAVVAGTRPVVLDGKPQNAGYIWESGKGHG